MFLHYLGHAGWLFEESGSTLLCDPWQSAAGAFYSGWFPFPNNEHVKFPAQVDAIYISHAHEDHFDTETLGQFSRETKIIIADFWDPVLSETLASLGFTNIRVLADSELERVGCFAVQVLKDEDSGMYHDSAIIVRSPGAAVLNLNDCRLPQSYCWESDQIDVLLGQCSGANWYPVAYEYPDNRGKILAAEKRRRGLERLSRAADRSGAAVTVPCAGPPAFLDPTLLRHNDVENCADNPFPMMDAAVDFLVGCGRPAFLALPGDVLEVGCESLTLVSRTMSFADVYGDRKGYIGRYAKRKEPVINERLAKLEIEPAAGRLFRAEWRRILSSSRVFVPQINAAIRFQLLGVDDGDILVDCREGSDFTVRDYEGETVNYQFIIDHRFVADLLRRRYINFENAFLGMRLKVRRQPDVFNDALFAILVNFDERRLPLAEQAFERAQHKSNDSFEIVHEGVRYRVQRRCPHMSADLSVVGEMHEGILTCTRHSWQFRLPDGKCVNVSAPGLDIRPIPSSDVPADSNLAIKAVKS